MDKMIRYNDAECEYSLFISYAFADDRSEDGWIRSLKNAIFQRIDGGLATNVPRKRIHFSGDDIPGGGTLGSQLEDRLQRSFAMLLVVGKQYTESAWCEQELALFRKWFAKGQDARLYIAVMGEGHLLRAQQGSTWKQIVAPDQLWTKMYRDQSRDRPLEHRLADGAEGFPPAFRDAAYAIADKLIKAIEADWKESAASSSAVMTTVEDALKTPLMPTASPSRVLRVAIGPFTESFDEREGRQPLALLHQTLQQAKVEVYFVDRSQLMKYDPSSGRPLRAALEPADVLIVPVLDENPLRPDLPGGHTTILADEWAALRKPQSSLVWYRPPPSEVAPEDKPDPKHVETFKRLAPVCPSPQAVVSLLFGVGFSEVIRVYIEKHPVIPIYGLSDAIEQAWVELHRKAGSKPPRLKCVPLLLDQIDQVPKDVAAVVLLDSNGHTPLRSLLDRESEVEKSFPKSSSAYPGLVAMLLRPPPPSARPYHEWGDVTFHVVDSEPPELKLDAQSAVWLTEFLSRMWRQYQKDSTQLH